MAVETKPLFNPELVRQQVHAFTPPDAVETVQPRLQHWADLIASGKADTFKETALLPEFLNDSLATVSATPAPPAPGTATPSPARPMSRWKKEWAMIYIAPPFNSKLVLKRKCGKSNRRGGQVGHTPTSLPLR
jgi:hypothetical protein